MDFETFYGDDWSENVEVKFSEWALRIFGGNSHLSHCSCIHLTYPIKEKDSKQREMYLLPDNPTASSQASTSEVSTSAPIPPAQKSKSRTTTSKKSASKASRKSSSQSLTSEGSSPEQSIPPTPSPTSTSTPQVTDVLTLPPVIPPPPADVPGVGDNMALFATAFGVHQLLSQAANVPQVSQAPFMTTSANPEAVEPFRLAIDPSRLTADLSQAAMELSQPASGPFQSATEPPESAPESSQAAAKVVPMDTQPDSIVTSVPPQLPTEVANAPMVRYRVQNPANVTPGTRSRRDSIEGAPEMVFDLDANSGVHGPVDQNEPEVTVDLRDYISMESDSDDESHISSSQKTADELKELLSPPPDSQQRRSGTERVVNRPQSTPTCASPQMDVDETDLPTWMVKRGQWMYIASTAGGPAWENLLKLYMQQERRLEFTDMVGSFAFISLLLALNIERSQGATLTNKDRPSKIKEYFRYAHRPTRGDDLTVPGFGAEVAKWWRAIQPEWRHSGGDPPQDSSTQWSYILSGGSKGVFLILMCLAWWDRAHARYLEEEKSTRRAESEGAGIPPNFDDLPDHDTEWSNIVNDFAFVLGKARDCVILSQEEPNPSRGTKRCRETEPTSPRKKSSKRRSRA